MLKENKNIDHSYTDRVVRQLVDETQIDFNAGKVHLPGTDYSWTFDHFGPGGLENALRMTPSNSFGHHIINSYGIDKEEFEEVLTKYIEVIAEKINRYLDPIFNLQENKNIDWDYTDRVVKQLVDETEIDFKNSRVKLASANFSFPFYSFGGRRAYPENIISEPKSNFGKYVISNYGVDETEYKEIYAMYMGIIASRLEDHDENVNHLYLHESTEDKFLDTIVSQLVDETEIDYDNGIPHISAFPDPDFSMDISFYLNKDLSQNLFGEMFKNFWRHCRNVYGLTDPEIQKVWWVYKTEVLKKIEWNGSLNESTEDNFLDKIVNQLVDETIIEDDQYDIAVAYPSWRTDEGFWGEGVAVDLLLNVDKNNTNFFQFNYYVNNMYGLDEDEIDYVWDQYRSGVWDKEQQNIYAYQKSLEDEELNESLSSRVKKEVDDLWDEDKKLKDEDKIKKHFEEKGLNKQDADEAMVQYLSKQQSLNESIETKEENHLDKVVEQIVSETMVNYRRGEIQFPFVQLQTSSPAYPILGLRHSFPPSSTFISSFYKYCRDVYGLTEDEMEYIWEKYQINLKEILNKILNESVDLSYSDDKDFPFLNKLANHTMSITEIERNAVLFPFIDGYISDGNFYKYFNGIPYDQLPFDATVKLDGYLRDFGLTENEKEIWWDIYVIKVMEAVGRRDLRIIDNYGELNESTEDKQKGYLGKVVDSIVKNSTIDRSSDVAFHKKGMIFFPWFNFPLSIEDDLKSFFESSKPHKQRPNFTRYCIENFGLTNEEIKIVLDELELIIKDEIEDVMKLPMSQWNLLYESKEEKLKQAQQRQIPPKQQKFFDHIIKTLVGETEVNSTRHVHDEGRERIWVTPPFLNHAYNFGTDPVQREDVEWNEFSYFGYGYARYMKDIYGLTDQEGLKVWALYYKALQKKVDELIERDRIIYGDD